MDGSTKEKLRVEGNQVMMLNIIVTQKRKDYSEIIKFILFSSVFFGNICVH